jgi:release factor glutamine methyltransferase
MTATIAAVIAATANRFRDANLDTPRLDAEILVRHVLGLDRTQLFVQLRDWFDDQKTIELDTLIERRLSGEPIAYVTGCREFMALPFRVGPGALVPRPETELLVERALIWLTAHPGSTVLDIGTGSGAIAVSIAKLSPGASVFASDISTDALKWARRNRDELAARVAFVLGDLIEPFRGPIDLVLANLPYLRLEQLAGNADLSAEPELALVSGQDGLNLIRRLIADLPRAMAPDGAVAFEIDPDQAAAVEALARDRFPGAIITTRRDLAGFARHVWIELAGGGWERWDCQEKIRA